MRSWRRRTRRDRKEPSCCDKRNDECELNIGKKAILQLNKDFPGRTLLFQFDGLYLARPILELIMSAGNCFLITFKEGCAPALHGTAMKELERRMAEYNAGKSKENPYKTFTMQNGLNCKVAYIEDIGGLSGDPEWAKYPINFVRADLENRRTIFNEAKSLKISTNRGWAEARKKNEETPLKDFSKAECVKLLKHYIGSVSSILRQIPFDSLLKDVKFVQTRDPRSGYRIVEVVYHSTFTWATNIILDLDNHEEIKKLLSDKLLNVAAAKKSDGHLAKRKNYIKNYMLNVVSQARMRWAIEEFFSLYASLH